jgi:DNA-3-methyladenine glycosylase II
MPAPLTLTADVVTAGMAHLHKACPVLSGVMHRAGPFTLKRERNRFGMLVRSIISQQISTAAARSIRLRLEALVAPGSLSAETILALDDAALRGAGLSPQKLSYLRDLCTKVEDGTVRLPRLSRMDDERVIEELIAVKGIGRWTAQMFLMFCLGRPDVFPHDDLGVRMALKRWYGLDDLPDRETSHTLAEPWRPYASIASWYCWRSGDLEKADAAQLKPTKPAKRSTRK